MGTGVGTARDSWQVIEVANFYSEQCTVTLSS
jgi:hypothetical protein